MFNHTSNEAVAQNDTHTAEPQDIPPSYSPDTSRPPGYDSIASALSSLANGDPDETISVPMVHRKDSKSLHRLNPFSREGYEKTPHYISVRKMKREQYLKHYAKNIDGDFVGTSNPAPDASLVFVPRKGTPEDLLKQLEDTAYGMHARRGLEVGK